MSLGKMFSSLSSISSFRTVLFDPVWTRAPASFLDTVRFRYYDPDAPMLKKRWGYKDKLKFSGTLPRDKSKNKPLPIPPYVPKNSWSEKRALFGQNDYIDLLGDGSIKPIDIAYGVPSWLRGFNGNEYQMLLRKRNFFGHKLACSAPQTFHDLNLRIKFLYRKLNYKTRHHLQGKQKVKF